MKNFNFVLSFIIVCLIMIVPCHSMASIFGKANPELLSDMYANPFNYVFVGAENFGVTFYIEKSSINVHQYDPPSYIISFCGVTHRSKDPMTAEYATRDEKNTRYKYDYTNRKMYREEYDNGIPHWEYVEIESLGQKSGETGGAHRWRIRKITEGEIAFYLAYGISFFDHPITDASEDFIQKHRSRIPSEMSPTKDEYREDNKNYYISNEHLYNHKERRYEIWQHKYDKKTKTWTERRIK